MIMNSKQKNILLEHRSFLSKNIVWTAELASILKARRLLTDSMIDEVQVSKFVSCIYCLIFASKRKVTISFVLK